MTNRAMIEIVHHSMSSYAAHRAFVHSETVACVFSRTLNLTLGNTFELHVMHVTALLTCLKHKLMPKEHIQTAPEV